MMKKTGWFLGGLLAVILIASFVFSGTVTKGTLGKQDIRLWYSGTSSQTFSRTSSQGYTMTLNPLDWVGIDVHQVYSVGTTRTGTIMASAASDVGYSTQRQMWLNPGTWTISADMNVGDYTDLTWVFAPGAKLEIATGVTVTFPSPGHIIAPPGQQIFSWTGTGAVEFTSPGDIHVGWFGAKGDCTTAGVGTDDYDAIQAAITCARKTHDKNRRIGSAIVFEPKRYLVQTSLFAGENSTTDSKSLYRIKGNGATLWGKHTGVILDYTGAHRKVIENLNFYGDSSTTPYCALMFARKNSTAGAGQTTIDTCWILGYFTVAGLINYGSEEFRARALYIDIQAGEFTALFTDTGYYYDSAGAWQQLTVSNADSDPGDVSSIDYYLRGCRFQHYAAAPSGAAALLQLVGASSFNVSDTQFHDDANDMPFIQILGDAAHSGAACYNTVITSNTFHGQHAKSIEFLVANAFNPTIKDNRWGVNAINIRSTTYRWTASGSGTNEYYCELAAGGDPSLNQPGGLKENSIWIPKGTLGSLNASEWGYGDNDTLGYSTIYVRLSDGADPDSKADDYLHSYLPDVYVNGVDLYDAYIECDTLDALAAGSEIFGTKLVIHEALSVAGDLDGEVLLDDAATITISDPNTVTARITRQGTGWESTYDPSRWAGTAVTTSGTGEDDLMTLTIPADYWHDYRAIRIIGAGNITDANNGNKTIKLKLTDSAGAPTTVTMTLAAAADYATGNWYFDISGQAGAATQAFIGFATVGAAVTSTQDETGQTLDLSTDITVKCTGECSDAGDTIRQHLLKIIPY